MRPGESNRELSEMPSLRAAASTNGFIDEPGWRPNPPLKVARLNSLAAKSRPPIIARTVAVAVDGDERRRGVVGLVERLEHRS